MYYGIIKLFNTTCIIKFITGIECPTCKSTRALVELIKLNYHQYMNYNPFALFVLVAVILLIHRPNIKYKKAVDIYSGISVGLNFIYWLAKNVL